MKFTFRKRILAIAILPMVILGIILTIAAVFRLNDVLSIECENGLISTSVAISEVLNQHEGEYNQDKNGVLYKGDYNLVEHQDVFDNIRDNTENEITLFAGTKRVITTILDESGDRIVGTELTGEVADKVLKNGESVFIDNMDINGKEYMAYYMPVYQEKSDTIVGMIFVGQTLDEKNQQNARLIKEMVILFLILGCISSVTSVFSANSITYVVNDVAKAIKRMTNGELNIKISNKSMKRKDIIGDMACSMNKLVDVLKKVIGEAKGYSEELYKSSTSINTIAENSTNSINDVEKAVSEIAEGASDQANETQKASDDVINMTDLLEETSDEIMKLNNNTDKMKEASKNAAYVVKELQKTNKMTDEAIDTVSKQTEVANESALKIKEAVDIISAITTQTNLLSLNASIEAARAGEQGKSFAVVASEIQILAEKSKESATVINNIVNSLISDSNKTVEIMGEVKNVVDKQTKNVLKTEEIFSVVNDEVRDTITTVEVIAQHSQKLDSIRKSIMDTIQNLSAIAQENAASSQQTAAATTTVTYSVGELSTAAESLQNVANSLEKTMSIFK